VAWCPGVFVAEKNMPPRQKGTKVHQEVI